MALFAGGFVLFASLYCVQPVLPELAIEFHLTPAVASLALSFTTGALSIFLLVAGSLSEAWGRKSLMAASLLGTAALTTLSAWSPSFAMLLTIRALQGIVLAGVPAVAMAYLSEEVHASSLGLAMGVYISGNAIGGMSGRIITGLVTDASSWRWALGTIGVLGLFTALWFTRALPPSKHFVARPLQPAALIHSLLRHLADPALLCLYGVGFLLMGSFVAVYNYMGFLLVGPPYHYSVATVGWIFLVYLAGTWSSTWMGRLADRLGRRRILWLGITLAITGALLTVPIPVLFKLAGLTIFTFGFFGAYSITSSWVGRRATRDRAQASSLYLFAYYAGSSIGGYAGGLFWEWQGWAGVIGMASGFLVLALLLSAVLARIPPVVTLTSRG